MGDTEINVSRFMEMVDVHENFSEKPSEKLPESPLQRTTRAAAKTVRNTFDRLKERLSTKD